MCVCFCVNIAPKSETKVKPLCFENPQNADVSHFTQNISIMWRWENNTRQMSSNKKQRIPIAINDLFELHSEFKPSLPACRKIAKKSMTIALFHEYVCTRHMMMASYILYTVLISLASVSYIITRKTMYSRLIISFEIFPYSKYHPAIETRKNDWQLFFVKTKCEKKWNEILKIYANDEHLKQTSEIHVFLNVHQILEIKNNCKNSLFYKFKSSSCDSSKNIRNGLMNEA